MYITCPTYTKALTLERTKDDSAPSVRYTQRRRFFWVQLAYIWQILEFVRRLLAYIWQSSLEKSHIGGMKIAGLTV